MFEFFEGSLGGFSGLLDFLSEGCDFLGGLGEGLFDLGAVVAPELSLELSFFEVDGLEPLHG